MARKYGLGLLLASQDLEHFTRDILTNVAAKLVLMHAETAISREKGKGCFLIAALSFSTANLLTPLGFR